MQNRKILRVLLCMMVLALCVSIFPGSASAKESDKIPPVFDLSIETDDGTKEYTAFCVKDPVTKCTYLLTVAEAAQWAEDGDITLSGVDYKEDADYLKTVGLVAYFWAPGLDAVSGYTPDGPLVKTIQISQITETDDGVLENHISEPQSLSGWKDHGHYWLGGQTEENTESLGAAVLKDKVGLVVGMLTRNEDNVLAVLSLDGMVYPEECAVVDENGNVVRYSDSESGPRVGLTTGITIGSVLAIAAVVIAIVAVNKKKGGKSDKKDESGSRSGEIREATAPMKQNEMASNLVNFPSTQPVRDGAAWQLRCIRGPLEGKVYPLNGTVTIGRAAGNTIQFSEGTKGVSGRHCQVTLSGGRAMVQDLNATYGTFYGLDHKAKLKPNMDYPLQSGDVIVLAEGGPAFRLEKLGAEKANFAVRNASGMVYKPNADGEITIGRASSSVVAYDAANSSVSGKHCKLYMKDNALYLMDLGSTNGTFFNQNQRLKPNVAYKVANGSSFFLVDERNTFVVVQE